MKTLAITSMYANPIHPWHIECLELSKDISDELWVIVNNDYQARLKRWKESFQDEKFREEVIKSIKYVDRTLISIDKTPCVCESLEKLIVEAKESWKFDKIIFTKWWDRFANEIPESKVCKKYWVEIVDWLWEKIHSSSDLIKKIENKDDLENIKKELSNLPEEVKEQNYLEIWKRPWWIYYVLEENSQYKVKKIIVNPNKRLSLQSHKQRSEHWIVVDGIATVDIRNPEFKDVEQIKILKENESCYIPKTYLHRLSNTTDKPLVIVEVQVWEYLWEDDIKRYDDDFWRN